MKQLRTSLLLVSTIIALSGCRQESSDSSDSTDTQADSLESAITMIAGQADDASGGSFALQTKSNAWKYAAVESLFYGSANAANCGRAYNQACNNSTGTKSITYNSCDISARGFSLSGNVTLQYDNNNCSLGVGESVTRTYDHTITGPRGGAIQTTSALRSAYDGTQIGGGGMLAHTSATLWTLEIAGKHKIGTRNGRTLFDVSARTTTPIAISNTLSRSGRTIGSGAIEVKHNRAGFTTTYTANSGQPLVWNSTCCHPVSGRLDATFSDAITGSGSITFNGCGTAVLSKDGSTRTLSLGYCE